jgi:KUP system potassium uptake protein
MRLGENCESDARHDHASNSRKKLSMTTKPQGKTSIKDAALTSIACLGVIWGDIGTSPLYTYSAVYGCEEACETPQRDDILETFSGIFWTLTIITFIKYILIVLPCDFHGEGGIFALLLNITRKPRRKVPKMLGKALVCLAAVGASAMMADGFITPALSVISALEGLRAPKLFSDSQISTIDKLIVPITCLILLLLFMMQRFGSTRVGRVLGPIMLIYFLSIAAIGIYNLVKTGNTFVLEGLSPVYLFKFFFTGRFSGVASFKKLSSFVLCVTGAEALFADVGHFSRRDIYITWGALVYPSLTLVYAGQAAAMIENPNIVSSAFWESVPSPVYIPMLIVGTLATMVASQAMISGCFSLISQAVVLSLFPRVRVVNTDPNRAGQIYIPEINFIMAVGTIILVVAFRSSIALAGAYGISVVITFNITTILMGFVLYCTKWPKTKWYNIVLAVLPLLLLDLAFLASNIVYKFMHGGYVTIAICFVISVIMICWWYGRILTAQARQNQDNQNASQGRRYLTTFDELANAIHSGRIRRGHGIGVFLTPIKLAVGRRINLSSLVAARAAEEGTVTTNESDVARMVSNLSGIVPVVNCPLPSALALYLHVTGSVQRVVILLHVEFDQDRPFLNISDRVVIEEVVTGTGVGIYSAKVTFGFAEPLSEVDMNKIVHQWVLEQIPMHRSISDLFDSAGERADDEQLWYFLYKEDHLAKPKSNHFRRALVWMYSALHTLSRSAHVFLNLPANESIHLGGCVFI